MGRPLIYGLFVPLVASGVAAQRVDQAPSAEAEVHEAKSREVRTEEVIGGNPSGSERFARRASDAYV
jgi:hypothetical protein